MALIPRNHSDPTTSAVKVQIVEAQSNYPSNSIGMGSIGDECERRIWLNFRRAMAPRFSFESLAAFADGHAEEARMITRLRALSGITLLTTNPQCTGQIVYTDLGGHFKGKTDGHIQGVLQAPKAWHIWEHKSTKQDKYNKLLKLIDTLGEKAALRAWDYTYYAQAMLYCHYAGFARHYMTVSLPGGRDFTGLRTEADTEEALRLRAKAERLIFSDRAPEKFAATDWRCKMCNLNGICHQQAPAQRNCRTCLSAEVRRDGTWHCTRFDKPLPKQEGCPSHLFLPSLVPGEQVDAGGTWVSYKMNDGTEWRDGK